MCHQSWLLKWTCPISRGYIFINGIEAAPVRPIRIYNEWYGIFLSDMVLHTFYNSVHSSTSVRWTESDDGYQSYVMNIDTAWIICSMDRIWWWIPALCNEYWYSMNCTTFTVHSWSQKVLGLVEVSCLTALWLMQTLSCYFLLAVL